MEKDDEKLLKEIDDDEFDDAFPKGIFAIPSPKCLPRYNVRAIAKYMKEKRIRGSLSDNELKQFRIEPKGYICRAVQSIEEATHWLPTFDDEMEECGITPYQLYRIFQDRYENEFLIMDDSNEFSLIYLWHNGRFVVVEKTT
ncbi:hypothetical protein PASE110613_12630 [Paenibacillus sediminis]|uniref:Uncharacterized protein n=1 Tax=Paenibacillus sediminis TaxID=664909 RepID=A0ABS4H5V7_9BACL|nr:hypothetical protein [Paenibacillus sediminis]MBP1937627.1 hypothetical protein [Paenibacillus sediminis]